MKMFFVIKQALALLYTITCLTIRVQYFCLRFVYQLCLLMDLSYWILIVIIT